VLFLLHTPQVIFKCLGFQQAAPSVLVDRMGEVRTESMCAQTSCIVEEEEDTNFTFVDFQRVLQEMNSAGGPGQDAAFLPSQIAQMNVDMIKVGSVCAGQHKVFGCVMVHGLMSDVPVCYSCGTPSWI
jgi:hypothetical protein